jgi:hypothetical protein
LIHEKNRLLAQRCHLYRFPRRRISATLRSDAKKESCAEGWLRHTKGYVHALPNPPVMDWSSPETIRSGRSMRIRLMACLLSVPMSQWCWASVACEQLDPGSPQYLSQINQVAREAGLNGRFTRYDEQVVLNICANRSERVDDLIDQGRVTAKEVSAVRKVLVSASNSPARAARGSAAIQAVPRKPSADEAAGMDPVIDNLFRRWSSTWWSDRYIPVSAHIAEELPTESGFTVRGQFSFVRGGNALTIPFASEIINSGGTYKVANLCYNDTTTGMTDCTASGNSSAATRAMATIIIGGIAAGLSGTGDSADSNDRERQNDENRRMRAAACANGAHEMCPYQPGGSGP